jgi:hypothetical protein
MTWPNPCEELFRIIEDVTSSAPAPGLCAGRPQKRAVTGETPGETPVLR